MSSSKERAQSVGHKPKTPNFGKNKIYQKPKVSRNGGLFSKINDDFSELTNSLMPSPYTPYIREGILEMNSEEENYSTIHNTPSNQTFYDDMSKKTQPIPIAKNAPIIINKSYSSSKKDRHTKEIQPNHRKQLSVQQRAISNSPTNNLKLKVQQQADQIHQLKGQLQQKRNQWQKNVNSMLDQWKLIFDNYQNFYLNIFELNNIRYNQSELPQFNITLK